MTPPSIILAEVLFMSDYYNNKGRSKRRTRREKIGFYTAFSICLIAVCMAVYSTYNTISTTKEQEAAITGTVADVQFNQDVTGVTETIPVPTLDAVYTIAATQPQTVEPTTEPQEQDALETMLSANVTLTYPLNSNNVLRAFSKESVYFKSLNVWKPHLGVDFAGELGDDVCAMAGGEVTKITDDKMYGKTVEISTNNVVCIYCGLGSVNVKEGDSVDSAQKIGVLGTVPCEATDDNHIHVAVKVDGTYADPLSFIGNNE